jgi:hypothetical protein
MNNNKDKIDINIPASLAYIDPHLQLTLAVFRNAIYDVQDKNLSFNKRLEAAYCLRDGGILPGYSWEDTLIFIDFYWAKFNPWLNKAIIALENKVEPEKIQSIKDGKELEKPRYLQRKARINRPEIPTSEELKEIHKKAKERYREIEAKLPKIKYGRYDHFWTYCDLEAEKVELNSNEMIKQLENIIVDVFVRGYKKGKILEDEDLLEKINKRQEKDIEIEEINKKGEKRLGEYRGNYLLLKPELLPLRAEIKLEKRNRRLGLIFHTKYGDSKPRFNWEETQEFKKRTEIKYKPTRLHDDLKNLFGAYPPNWINKQIELYSDGVDLRVHSCKYEKIESVKEKINQKTSNIIENWKEEQLHWLEKNQHTLMNRDLKDIENVKIRNGSLKWESLLYKEIINQLRNQLRPGYIPNTGDLFLDCLILGEDNWQPCFKCKSKQKISHLIYATPDPQRISPEFYCKECVKLSKMKERIFVETKVKEEIDEKEKKKDMITLDELEEEENLEEEQWEE